MKMKKADEAQAAKADKMRDPQWAEYSGWPPEKPAVTTSKIVAKVKKVAAEIVAPLEEKADGDSN